MPYIESYWLGTFNLIKDSGFSLNIVPNGCIELIIHLSDDHCSLNKKGNLFHKSPPYTLLGIYSKPYIVKFPALVNVLGIRFFPDGIRNIFGLPPACFLSTYEDGIDVIGKKLNEICSRIKELARTEDRLKVADQFFSRQLEQHRKIHDYTHHAMKYIRNKNGLIKFKELTDKIPISPRQLQREFKSTYGMNITEYIRITRLNTINKYLKPEPQKLTEIAHQLDFSDQSHFIREFKHYLGMSPGKFMKNRDRYIVIEV